MRIAVVDYKMGNLHSIVRRIQSETLVVKIASTIDEIRLADKIILPGVGHFGQAMKLLNELDLIDELNESVLIKKKPILGICLGMQIMAKSSQEGSDVSGLGWFDADIKKLEVSDSRIYKIPHIGWTGIKRQKESELMRGIEDGAEFYFVHSYYCECKDETDILNSSHYDVEFTSAIEKDNIFGVQYHPEKSHSIGSQLLKNFLTL